MEAMNMNNESRRAVLKSDGAYELKIKGASVYLHNKKVQNAISGSSVENGSRLEVQHQTARFLRLARFLFLVVAATAISVGVANLQPETVQQWEDYVKAADTRHADRLAKGTFLSSDEIAGRTSKLRIGGVVVTPASQHVPLEVHSGLIHDWTGAAFIPNAKLDDVLPVLRDYDRYKDYYRPNVVCSKRIATSESRDQFSMVLMNKSVVGRTALDTDYRAAYTRIDDRRWYSVADATRIQEIAEYDTPSQHILPENHGTGLIWRLHSITRFEERDGGVYIEVEAIALSRDIPAALRWVVEPVVRRVSRSAVATSLLQTEAAVRSRSSAETAGINGRLPDPGMRHLSGTATSTSSLARPLR
jgi:hypothetical protein